MTPKTTVHLTEEEFDDVLIGLGSAESEAHAAACSECRSKLDAFRADMALFNRVSMAWSENRPGIPAARVARPAAHPGGPRVRFGFVSWAAVAALLVVTAVAVWRHAPAPPPHQIQAVESQPVDSEAQIAQDNELLQAVNAAISADEDSPVGEYKLLEETHSHLKTHPRMRTR